MTMTSRVVLAFIVYVLLVLAFSPRVYAQTMMWDAPEVVVKNELKTYNFYKRQYHEGMYTEGVLIGDLAYCRTVTQFGKDHWFNVVIRVSDWTKGDGKGAAAFFHVTWPYVWIHGGEYVETNIDVVLNGKKKEYSDKWYRGGDGYVLNISKEILENVWRKASRMKITMFPHGRIKGKKNAWMKMKLIGTNVHGAFLGQCREKFLTLLEAGLKLSPTKDEL